MSGSGWLTTSAKVPGVNSKIVFCVFKQSHAFKFRKHSLFCLSSADSKLCTNCSFYIPLKNYIARFGHGSAKLARQAQSKEKTLQKMVASGLTEKVVNDKVL